MIANCRNLRALVWMIIGPRARSWSNNYEPGLKTEAVFWWGSPRRVGRGAFDLVLMTGASVEGWMAFVQQADWERTGAGKVAKLLLVTAYGRDDLWPRAQQAGVGGMLIKPIQKLALRTALGNSAECRF